MDSVDLDVRRVRSESCLHFVVLLRRIATHSHSLRRQGGTATWLRDAAANGSKFMTGTEVERLLFATSSSSPLPTEVTLPNFTPSASRRRCIGALIVQNGTKAIVLAREAVVVSGGTLNSPAILLRSGLKNPAIGKNLYLHPTSFVTAYFDEPVMPFEGAILTAVSNARENVDGNHYGVKIEGTSFSSSHPPRARHPRIELTIHNSIDFVPGRTCRIRPLDWISGAQGVDDELLARLLLRHHRSRSRNWYATFSRLGTFVTSIRHSTDPRSCTM